MTPAMPLTDQQPPQAQDAGALGNRVLPPRRAIDKMMMNQQQQKGTLAFPMGVPQNQTPPQMQPGPVASSFMSAVLGK